MNHRKLESMSNRPESREGSPYPSLVHHPLPRDYYDPEQDPRKGPIQTMLHQNFWAMVATYSVFSIGWLVFLFTQESRSGLGLMLAPFVSLAVYSRFRNRVIRRMGYSKDHPFPSSWSTVFHDREPEVFKAFTTLWTFSFMGWVVLKYFRP